MASAVATAARVFGKAGRYLSQLVPLIRQWRHLSGSWRGKRLLIVGNGPAVSELDMQRVTSWLRQSGRAVLFVNGFLSHQPFDLSGVDAYLACMDPDLATILAMIRSGKSRDDLIADWQSGKLRDVLMYPEYNYSTIMFDIEGAFRALSMKNLTWITRV